MISVSSRRILARNACLSYAPTPRISRWFTWFGRSLGGAESIIGHCDVAPWNIVARDGTAVAPIDWDRAGPVEPLVEVAQACW